MNAEQIAKLKEVALKAPKNPGEWPFYLRSFQAAATPVAILELIVLAESALLAAAPAPIQKDADAPARQALHTMEYEDGRIGWYFDCDGHYIDVEKDGAGKYSVYFRDRATGKEGWLDQADSATPPALAGSQVQAAVDAVDAARYRWLKSKGGIDERDGGYHKSYWLPRITKEGGTIDKPIYHADLDSAIDAAMREQP